MPKSSNTSAANADTPSNYAPGIKNPFTGNLFTGKPLPEISELSPVRGITKPPSSAAVPRTSSMVAHEASKVKKVPKAFYPTFKKMYPHRRKKSYSVPPPPPVTKYGGSRRRTVHRKHKSYRKSKHVRHTRRKQTRRHRHRR